MSLRWLLYALVPGLVFAGAIVHDTLLKLSIETRAVEALLTSSYYHKPLLLIGALYVVRLVWIGLGIPLLSVWCVVMATKVWQWYKRRQQSDTPMDLPGAG